MRMHENTCGKEFSVQDWLIRGLSMIVIIDFELCYLEEPVLGTSELPESWPPFSGGPRSLSKKWC